ncbi:MAG: hypothetical protein AAGN64_16875 [Bacteroidota bacterium]
MPRILSTVLNQLLYEPGARYTAADIAEVCEVSTSMIYKVANDDAELSMNRIARLSRWLCEHGDTRLLDCFMSPEFVAIRRGETSANGRIDDEAAHMMAAFGDAITAFRRGDRAQMTKALADAQRALDNATAECDRL